LFRDYGASEGRWSNRDPIGESGGMNVYGFVGNDTVQRYDMFGLDWAPPIPPSKPYYPPPRNEPPDHDPSEPDVSWGPPACPKGQITAFVQVVVGYKWSSGGPHVDNGSLGFGSSSTGCPLYPLPSNTSGVFQDSPRGWIGRVRFIVCRVCLVPCCFVQRGRAGNNYLPGLKIVSVGPCVYWKKGDRGDLSDGNFTRVDGPNQDWQVGMDTDFPDAAKGGCFKCTR
jgi:hypothetical protein